jgi:hypothetical protein
MQSVLIISMKISATTVVLAFMIMLTTGAAHARAWRGIVPLRSTRADVERSLGPPTLEDSGYDLDGERVQISYASQGCQEGLPGGWKVPTDTVATISVSSRNDLKLADVLAAGRNYDQIYSVHMPQLIDYVDLEEGVRYTTIDGTVQSITYFGSESDDKRLRCGEYKYAAPVPSSAKNKFEQVPYDSYGKIPFEDAEARLDNFELELRSLNEAAPRYRGFIIVYAGKSAHAAEAGSTAACSKNYLVNTREADPATLVAADGGYRTEFLVELYIMPTDAYPPMLMPTVSPKKVEILPGRLSPCSKRPFDAPPDTP